MLSRDISRTLRDFVGAPLCNPRQLRLRSSLRQIPRFPAATVLRLREPRSIGRGFAP